MTSTNGALRVAVPNKGALSEAASEILSEAGYRRRGDAKDLTVLDPQNDVEFFFLRPKDIAIYVGSGELDLGITGRDLMMDSDAPVTERLALGFGARPSGTPRPQGGTGRSTTSRERKSPPRTPTWSERTWPPKASKPRSSGWTAPSRFPSSSGWPM
ncbi:ATP phosphoribosyltransferase [Mycobacteroides abscessus MAB_082312_2258]|nr:ATP phosphoribosyltransferase [Mycobacteroides abscessus MAB_082312_2258]